MIEIGKIEQRTYERITLKQLVRKIGLGKVVGEHTVSRVFAPSKYPTATVCFSVRGDSVTYDVRYSINPAVLDQLGLKARKSMVGHYITLIVREDGSVALRRDRDVIGGTAYLWDSRGFWRLESLAEDSQGGDDV
jgi:hypothetical protein